MELNIIIGVGGFVLSLVTFCFGRLSAANKKGEQNGTLLSDIGYLKANTDEIKSDIKEQRSFNSEMTVKLAQCESRISEISHRLNDHIIQKKEIQ